MHLTTFHLLKFHKAVQWIIVETWPWNSRKLVSRVFGLKLHHRQNELTMSNDQHMGALPENLVGNVKYVQLVHFGSLLTFHYDIVST
jgi:hypothetical protein